MGPRLVLILGGTTEAACLARRLQEQGGWTPLTSLAGRTSRPARLAGELRTGGFGGVEGLVDFLSRHRPAAVIDATHPFARQMPHHASAACARLGIPRLRLVRPVWPRQAEDRWLEVAGPKEAVRILPDLGRAAFLSTGHEAMELFATLAGRMRLVVRTIEPPDPLPQGVTALQARPPFSLQDEIGLLRRFQIDVLVTKAAGGAATAAKIEAARHLSLPVVMLARPPLPDGPLAPDVGAALRWLEAL